MVFRCGRIRRSTGRRAGRRSTAPLMRSGCSRATALRRWRRYSAKLESARSRRSRACLSPRERSPAVRYARLMDDVRNDITRLPQFFETAARVLDIDQKRQKSMALVSALSPAERKNAERRMRENAAIVALTREKLAQRGVVLSLSRSSASSSRRRRRRRPTSSARSINCKRRSRATAPRRRPGCASRTWSRSADYFELFGSSRAPWRRRSRFAPSASIRAPAPARGSRSARSASAIPRSAGRRR